MKKEGMISTFKRLALLFGVMILLLYAAIAAAFFRFAQIERRDEARQQQNRVESMTTLLNQQIKSVYTLAQTLAQDNQLERLACGVYENQYDRSQMILDLQTGMKNSLSQNDLLKKIEICFVTEGIGLSTDEGYEKRTYSAEELQAEEYTGNQLKNAEGELVLNYSYPLGIEYLDGQLPDYVIHIELSEEYLNSFLEPLRAEAEQGVFLLLGSDETAAIVAAGENPGAVAGNWNDLKEEIETKENTLWSGTLRADGKNWIIWTEQLQAGPVTLVACQNSTMLNQTLGGTLLALAGILILVFLLFAVGTAWISRTIRTPLYAVMTAFGRVENGDLEVRLTHETRDEFRYIYEGFNRMLDRLQELIADIREQDRLLQGMELMQLQSQINPHFLYNSFFVMKYMAQNEEYEQIDAFATSLAKYYRFINKEVNQTIPLKNEAEHMECYVDIQQTRFGDKITVEKDELPANAADFPVPKLILQPLVENAYQYGLHDVLADGKMWIRYETEGHFLRISVEDNGGQMTEERLRELKKQVEQNEGQAIRHALNNVRRRLELAYGTAGGLTLEVGKYRGLKVTICLDLTAKPRSIF